MPSDPRLGSFEHADERRRVPRRQLNLQVVGNLGSTDPTKVMMHDLSQTGILLETSAFLSVGGEITVDLPQAGPVAAAVVWRSGLFVGAQFVEPISDATLAAAQLLNPSPRSHVLADQEAHSRNPAAHEPFTILLKRLRQSEGMSRAQFAERLNVSTPTLWSWEKGRTSPRKARIAELAKLLNVPATELFRHDNAQTTSSAWVDEEEVALTESDKNIGSRAQLARPVEQSARLPQLIQASKEQIANLVGTTAEKVRITIEA